MFISLIFLFLLLTSELLFFLNITKKALFPAMQKTYLYLAILVCGFLMLGIKRRSFEPVVIIFLCFSLLTCFSTAVGVTPDISIWRQCIHLMLFSSMLVIFYIGTELTGRNSELNFLYFVMMMLLTVYLWSITNTKIKTENTVYYVLMFLPMISFMKRGINRKILYSVLVLAVILSNKRTALLAVVAYFLAAEFTINKKISKRKKICKAIAYIAIIIIVSFVYPVILKKFGITVFDEISNISSDGGSNRLYIYAQLWKAQVNGGIKHWLIGEGYNSVLLSKICTDGAGGLWVSGHNDFLEVLYDYGLIGVVLYISFFVGLIKKGVNMVKDDYTYAYSFIASIAFVLVMSMTSHLIIYLNYYAVVMVFWAKSLADYKRFCNYKYNEVTR